MMRLKNLIGSVAFLCAMLALSNCASDESAEDIGNSLAERLTDALAFDGGEPIEEPPPVGIYDESQPQITGLIGPDELMIGDEFNIELTTDWETPSDIAMAVVWVKGSKRHIWVMKDIYPEGANFSADLGGLLKDDPELVGHTFTLLVALQIDLDIVGAYVPWEFTVKAN